MKKLAGKIDEVYNYVVSYVDANGYPPSVREICTKCSIKSTATAYSYLNKLVEGGFISKSPQKKRALVLTSHRKDVSIPLVGAITAGMPILAVQNLEGYVPLPQDFDGNVDFALRVKGDSMKNAGIFDRDIILVKRQDSADNGDIVVALIDDSATVKRFFIKDNKYVLHPENEEFTDIILNELSVLGIVKGLIRRF